MEGVVPLDVHDGFQSKCPSHICIKELIRLHHATLTTDFVVVRNIGSGTTRLEVIPVPGPSGIQREPVPNGGAGGKRTKATCLSCFFRCCLGILGGWSGFEPTKIRNKTKKESWIDRTPANGGRAYNTTQRQSTQTSNSLNFSNHVMILSQKKTTHL